MDSCAPVMFALFLTNNLRLRINDYKPSQIFMNALPLGVAGASVGKRQ
jgi:hypothetical protein